MTPKDVKKRGQYLLAFDGSEHARAAVSFLHDFIIQQGEKTKSSIVLLAVFTPRQIGDLTPLEQALDQTYMFFKEKGIRARPELVLGYPGEKILEYTEKLNPKMIVVGAKGLRATLGILLGGVAQEVVESAPCPVMVIRAPYQVFQRILLVADGSPYSRLAMDHFTKFHLAATTRIDIMNVLPPIPIKPVPDFITHSWPAGPEVIPQFTPELTEEESAFLREEEKEGQKILDEALSLFQKKGSKVQLSQILVRGDTASEIIQYAKENRVDLIVTGSQSLGAIRSMLLGSVTRKLVHYAHCSVLVVKQC